jgi:hypothetical protein
MRAEPMMVAVLRLGPGPVNAREPDEAVTTRADEEEVVLAPEVFEVVGSYTFRLNNPCH